MRRTQCAWSVVTAHKSASLDDEELQGLLRACGVTCKEWGHFLDVLAPLVIKMGPRVLVQALRAITANTEYFRKPHGHN